MGDAVGGIVGGVGSIVGGAMGSDASSSAARAQQRAAEEANALQRELYEKNTANFQPYLDAGNSGLQALMYRLGLGGSAGGSFKTADQLRQELLPQYTAGGNGATDPSNAPGWVRQRGGQWMYNPSTGQYGYRYDANSDFGYQGDGQNGPSYGWYTPEGFGAGSQSVNESGLQAAINARLADQDKQRAAQENDPNFGFLLKRFSDTNWQADPGYQFRLDQGNKALQNMGAMTGNLNSGRAIKDAIGYNSGMASQEYGNAYNRFNTDQTNIYNKLAALAGMGQSSASSLAGVSQNYGAQVGNNLSQAANAQAAGTIGSNNAWAQGISGLGNALGGMMSNRGSGYSGTFQPTSGVGGLSSGQGVNGWW
ncbi:hypothetical protein ACOTDF_19315 [Achromobacter insuavis]|uniref:hypothetical protein n=1 Tax=Achromobacter insuavis TaxID=1287735 RepID=UPI003B9918CA